MTAKLNIPEHLECQINQEKVGHIVIDALHQILPHLKSANTAELMLAFIMMMKTTIHSHPKSAEMRMEAKALFDLLWPTVMVDHNIPTVVSATMH